MIHDIISLVRDQISNYGFIKVERFNLNMVKEVRDETTVFSTKDSSFHTTSCHSPKSDKILIISWRSDDLQDINNENIELLGVQYINKSKIED